VANQREGGNGAKVRRERLFQVLQTYGADPALWPEAEREGLLQLVAQGDGSIDEAVRAARELDAILATAPALAVDSTRSLERFLARLPGQLSASPPVLDLDRHRASREAAGCRNRLPWPAFGALAASLLAGLLIGAGGLARDFIPPLLAGETGDEELWLLPDLDEADALLEDDER
jgi:hypothetical protein